MFLDPSNVALLSSTVFERLAFAVLPSQDQTLAPVLGPVGGLERGWSGSVISTSTRNSSSMEPETASASFSSPPDEVKSDAFATFLRSPSPKSSLARILPLPFFVPSSPVASSFRDIRFRSARNSGSSVNTALNSESVSTFTGVPPGFKLASAGINIRRGHNISSLIQLFVASLTALRNQGTRFTSRPPPTRTSSAMTGGSGKDKTMAPYPGSFRDNLAINTRTVPSNFTS
mmetsp:Transcript_1265/g.4811  ORF Transcript_1265/g.4811 Transcript_1265/m.4811 type:complete len:231 (+) Transcript_1265:326-1018(+)